jgi:hypothetical protein
MATCWCLPGLSPELRVDAARVVPPSPPGAARAGRPSMAFVRYAGLWGNQ